MNWKPQTIRTLLAGGTLRILALFAGSLVISFAGCQSVARLAGSTCEDDIIGNANISSWSGVQPCSSEQCERSPDIGLAAVPVPVGTYVNDWNDAMICSTRRHGFVVSRHEWFSGGEQLGPEGQRHVQQAAIALTQGNDRLLLEAEPVELMGNETLNQATTRTDRLNELRRQELVRNLVLHGVAEAEQRVVFAPIDRVGVRGIEAPRIYNRLLQGTGGQGRQQGRVGSTGSGFGGAAGGGGFF